METNLIVWFGNETQALIKAKYERIGKAHEKYVITRITTDDELEQIKASILRDLWRWPTINVSLDARQAVTEVIKMDIRTAQSLIKGGFHYSGSTVEVIKVAYKVNYEGSVEALKHSKGGGNRISFHGNLAEEFFEIHYFTKSPAQNEVVDAIKREKEELLKHVSHALQSNAQYLQAEQLKFQNAISEHVNLIAKYVKDKGSNDDLFSS